MEHPAYQYALDILTEDGTALGQVPIEPDWVPALEWVRFQAIRRGDLPAQLGSHPGVIEPIWDAARGEPHVSGFRALIPTHNGAAVSSDFPTTYVRSLARQASTVFVGKGVLKAGDLFRYKVCAFLAARTDPPRDASTGISVEVEEIARPLPLAHTSLQPFIDASVHDGPAAVSDDVPVLVPQRILDEVVSLSRQAKAVEVGGVLVGKLHRDPETREVFVEVTAQIPARHTLSEATKLTFTPETWAAVDAAITLRRQDETKLGWWHYHPDWCRNCPPEKRRDCTLSNGFFSADDVHLHRVCFGAAYHIALLINDSSPSGIGWSLFGWHEGEVTARGFNIIDGAPARDDQRAARSAQ